MCEQNRMQIHVYTPGQIIEVFLDSQDPVHIGQIISLRIRLANPVKEFYGYAHLENGDIFDTRMVKLRFKITGATSSIDDVKLYNRAMDEGELQKLPNWSSNCINVSMNRSNTVYEAELISLHTI